jgi:hypothetical protein
VLILSACSTTTPTKTSNTDFISGYTTVLGTGKTVEEAKQNGFIKAVQYVVGSVMLTQQEVIGNRMVRDEVVQHSSGYVEDYIIKSTDKTSNGYSVSMDVKVRSSKISETILGKNLNTTTEFNGNKIVTQSTTLSKSRETGADLLEHVIDDYFKFGVNVVNNTNWRLNDEQDTVVTVNYVASYNQKWFQSLDETLKILSNTDYSGDKIQIEYKKEGDMFSTLNYYFLNRYLAENLHNKLNQINYIQISLMDGNKNVMYSRCERTNIYQNGVFYSGLETFKNHFGIIIKKNSWLGNHLNELKYVNTTFVNTQKGCNINANKISG